MNPLANGKFQGLLKAFEFFKDFSRQILFSRTFQDSPVYSSTFQACANPVTAVLKSQLFGSVVRVLVLYLVSGRAIARENFSAMLQAVAAFTSLDGGSSRI